MDVKTNNKLDRDLPPAVGPLGRSVEAFAVVKHSSKPNGFYH
jgi:hypothetical protein